MLEYGPTLRGGFRSAVLGGAKMPPSTLLRLLALPCLGAAALRWLAGGAGGGYLAGFVGLAGSTSSCGVPPLRCHSSSHAPPANTPPWWLGRLLLLFEPGGGPVSSLGPTRAGGGDNLLGNILVNPLGNL